MKAIFTHDALLPSGWARNVRIELDATGTIARVECDTHQDGAQPASGPVIPGMPNVHSHAFQRAMAGTTEVRAGEADTFWSWREAMYAFVERITPDDAYAIAAQAYVELARSGYTSVAEFHYLHRRPDGSPYPNVAEMARAQVRAARDAGIAITLLPVVYTAGGFGEAPLEPRQARFRATPEDAVRIAEAVATEYADDDDVSVGVAAHSLRAVPPADLDAVTRGPCGARGPIHLHLAEQRKEVDDCLSANGARPIAWLLDHAPVDERWCLIHATQATPSEIAAVARTGAVVGLCPTTEANLGDGVFLLDPFLAAGGRFGVGSDSNVSRSPIEELRWLEYGQRLTMRRRNVASTREVPSVGARLWGAAVTGGAQAVGRRTGAIAPGYRADLLVLDESRSAFAGLGPAQWLDALVFSGSEQLVRNVMAGGRWIVRDHHHAMQEGAVTRFKQAMAKLRA